MINWLLNWVSRGLNFQFLSSTLSTVIANLDSTQLHVSERYFNIGIPNWQVQTASTDYVPADYVPAWLV